MFLNIFNSVALHIEVWFTDQNNKSLKAEAKINLPLVNE